jgi:PAS domain S-box-containing protein
MSTPNPLDLAAEVAELRARLAEAEETLEAIRTGAVDALVVAGPAGDQVFTLQGAETPYRLLIESMNEGAATLGPDGTILYCNARFADMVATPAEQVIGSPLWQCVVPSDQHIAHALVDTAQRSAARAELTFTASGGLGLSVLVSLRPIQKDSNTIGVVVADLSERKRAEAALRQAHDVLEQRVCARTEELNQQREWLSVTLSSIGDALVATGTDGRITFLNPVAEALTGWPREEAVGQPVQSVFRIFDETTRIPGEDIVGRVLRQGASIKLANNTCLITRAGHEIPIEDSAAPIKDSDGKVAGAVLVFHDVTAKRRALQALRQSEQRYHLLFDRNPDAVFAVDATGRFMEVNPACEAISGYSAEELRQKTFMEICAADQLAGTVELFERSLRLRTSMQLETALVRKDGRRVELWVAGEPLTVGQKLVVHCTAKDITAHKEAEAAVRRSEALLRAVTDNSPDAIYVKDLHSRWLLANPAVLRVVGKTAEEALGKTDLELYADPAIGQAILENDRRILERGQTEAMEEVADTPEGRRTFVSVKAPRRDEQGNIIGLIGISHDMTDRKRAEEALRESEALAKVAEAVQVEQKRFRQALDQLPVYVILLSPDYRVPFANRFFEERFGKANGKRCYEYLFNRTEPCENCETFKVLKTGQPHHWEWTGPDNRNYDIDDFPFTDVDGSPMIMEVSIDVTPIKQAEAQLKAERQRLFDVLETLPAMICLLTPDHQIAFANRGFRERFGESQGRRCYECCFGKTEPCEFCESYKVLETGRPHHWEVKAPDGSVIDAYDFPFKDVDGTPMILEMDMDITERRLAEAELKKHREHLTELVEQRTAELRKTNAELTRFNEVMVGRELRMIELKQQINALSAKLGQPSPYPSQPGLPPSETPKAR